MKVRLEPRHVCAGLGSDVMCGKVYTCPTNQSSLSRRFTMSHPICFGETFIIGMFDHALYF